MAIYHNRVYYGVLCPRSVFWKDTGERRTVCGAHFSHPVESTANFCQECGHATRSITMESPTDRFATICDAVKEDPAYVFSALKDPLGWEWSNDDSDEPSFHIRWESAASFDWLDRSPKIMMIGFQLAELAEDFMDDRSDPKLLAIRPTELAIYEKAIAEISLALELTEQPALYFQTQESTDGQI